MEDNCSRRVLAVLCAALCLALGAPLEAQSADGTASGTVADVAGKPIAGAAVSVKSESAGAVRQATTDTEGKFSVSGLPEGLYTIEASAPSFATSRRTGVKLAQGGTDSISMSLNVG